MHWVCTLACVTVTDSHVIETKQVVAIVSANEQVVLVEYFQNAGRRTVGWLLKCCIMYYTS